MDLSIQIISLLFSFLYGVFFSLFANVNYKIIYHDKNWIKFVGTFLVVMIGVLLYFVLLRKINYAAFHPYLLLSLAFGFAFEKRIANYFKK